MANCAVVGINWGDEGKGRMIDYFAHQYDIVVRYQGGSNAGHTVVSEYGKFALNLIPAGIFRKNTVNLLGPGTVIDLKHLCKEIESLQNAGVEITPENFKISDRATIVLPLHAAQDRWEEERLGQDQFYGSTLRGITPVYGDRFMNKALLMGVLKRPEQLKQQLKRLVDWKNQVFARGYNRHRIDFEETLEWVEKYGSRLVPYLCNATQLLENAQQNGKHIIFEAQQGAMRDCSYGTYPYVSSASTLSHTAPVSSGLPSARVDEVLGVIKAYSTCIGEGPFVGELDGEAAFHLREAGGEYGAATGRPRRVGWLDVFASRHGAQLQGATALALTKLDVLSYLDEIPVCVGYMLNGQPLETFPDTEELFNCTPVYEMLPGWKCDISECASWVDLPPQARSYITFVEEKVGCPITHVSVGPEREKIIVHPKGAR